MNPLEPMFFVDGGHQWVTELWAYNGVVCCENTHPVYDENGNPLPAIEQPTPPHTKPALSNPGGFSLAYMPPIG